MEVELPASASGMPPRHAPDILAAVRAEPSALYSPTDCNLPGRCIDGRPAGATPKTLTPGLPGAFLSILLGWALAHREDPLWGARELEQILHQESEPCATHTGTALDPDGCGCGAIDFLPQILDLACRSGELAELIGLGTTTGHAASTLLATCPGSSLVREFVAADTEITDLIGTHEEIGILVNKVSGTTLDPVKLHERYGDVQFFHVDAWAFDTTAQWVAAHCSVDKAEIVDLLASFTAAALAILCGPGFPVIVHDEKSSK